MQSHYPHSQEPRSLARALVMEKIRHYEAHRVPGHLLEEILSDKDYSYFELLQEELGDDLLRIQILPNYHFTEGARMPQGVAIKVKANARLNPNLFSDRIGSVVLSSLISSKPEDLPIMDEQTFEEYFLKRFDNFSTSVKQKSEQGICLYNEDQVSIFNDAEDWTKDTFKWQAAMGKTSRGNYVTVKHVEVPGEEGSLYLEVKTDSGTAGKQLQKYLDLLSRQSTFTFKHITDGNCKVYNKTVQLANRNARRVLAEAAESIRAVVKVAEDSAAYVSNERHAKPDVAIPQYVNPLDGIYSFVEPDGTEVAVVCSQAIWVPAAKGGLIFNSIPGEKSVVYDLPFKQRNLPLPNAMFGVFYPFTGPSRSAGHASSSSNHLKAKKKVITWEGKRPDSINSKITNAYRPHSSYDSELIKEGFGLNFGSKDMKTIMSKISSD